MNNYNKRTQLITNDPEHIYVAYTSWLVLDKDNHWKVTYFENESINIFTNILSLI